MKKKILGIRPEALENVKERRKLLLGVGLTLLTLGAGAVGWRHFSSQESIEEVVTLDERKLEMSRAVVFRERRPTIIMNGNEMTSLTRVQQKVVITEQLKLMGQRTLVANYGNQYVTTTLENLGIQLESDLETVLDDLELLESELDRKSASELRVPTIYSLEFTYCEEKLKGWVQLVAGQLNVSSIEPSLAKVSRGNFNVTEGSEGKRVVMNQLKADVANAFQNVTVSNLSVDVVMKTAKPTRDTNLFASVDTRIAYAQSSFSRAEAGRAGNVDRGAQLISGTLLMPGEKFSFNNLVFPVTSANGFGSGTVFRQGQPVQGIGGGLCQVSSTVYWAQLRTGISATYRRGHSRPVFYVPHGLDATMYIGHGDYTHKLGLDETVSIGQIDYTFINTLDYPLYLNAFTEGGALTVEFWSNSEALNGLTFEPRTTRAGATASTKSYDTFLRKYNATTNQLISEEWIHRSTYNTAN